MWFFEATFVLFLRDYIKPSVVPIIIVGTKYDVFRDFEP